jgi:DNA-binding CsgD family transcriptional regulator
VRAVLRHALAREEAGPLAAHFATMLEDMPIGLLLLGLDLRLIWYNGEAANACAVWNHGERRAAALNPRRNFRVPAALLQACAGLRAQCEPALARREAFASRPVMVSDHGLGLHAQIVLRAPGNDARHRPAFGIQLDYRRPRGDRNRPLSPGAVAALARLSAREREVVMGVREGLSTRQIAAEQRRSPLTIKTQLSAIYAKLGVRGRTQVAALLNR